MITNRHTLLDRTDLYRLDADRKINPDQRMDLGQFMTPAPVARFMASLFSKNPTDIRLLEPGSGVGSLISAFVDEIISHVDKPKLLSVDAWEIDQALLEYLETTLRDCASVADQAGIHFEGQAKHGDFIESTSAMLIDDNGLFRRERQSYTHCIMNPPYRKILSASPQRAWLRNAGIETSNLYTGFLALVVKLLGAGGELVAIVPRSFCNGVYFKAFRRFFLKEMAIRHLHVFVSRDRAFQDNNVLQENIIIYAIKGVSQGKVIVTSSHDTGMDDLTSREVDFNQIVDPEDKALVINIAANEIDQLISNRIHYFSQTLVDLEIDVSTGAVVDFRAEDDICHVPEDGAHPLIYPSHFSNYFIEWPKLDKRKPNAIRESDASRPTLMPNGWYVLTRRFSSKEEKRRIIAAIHNPERVPGEKIGFENHLNVFHANGQGLNPTVAKGLAIYLNSTLVDMYFRQFSGHTQVNASDLRSLPYPNLETLQRLGHNIGDQFLDQQAIDNLIESEISTMADNSTQNPVAIQHRIQEALDLLTALGLPRGQRNERSALTLLALLDLKPDEPWQASRSPMIGITPIMDFAREHYGRQYAPNTRETFRRFTMHQFVQAGIAILNPDRPDRPPNSPQTVYQIAPHVLALVQHIGDDDWQTHLAEYLKVHKTLAEQYARAREMNVIPLVLPEGTLNLVPGAHSLLIKAIVDEFGPRFAPGAKVLYVGDTGAKMIHFDEDSFVKLGLAFDLHGKFPDVVLFWEERNWLFLIESVTSHGPVDSKRHTELASLFAKSSADLVYVTAFPDRQTMTRYLSDISWETEVWIADSPSHLIHFDGERFLGPY